jgi:NAD(P)-dependent dehydrogenase (short-subunit alcohol dehydrogenase family)
MTSTTAPSNHGKVCILTGATGGIGAAIARRLAAQGARLMLVDMPGTPLPELAEELRAAWTFADVADDAAVKAYTDATMARFGAIDAVLANAGTEGRVAPITASKPEDVARLFAVNVFGPFSAIRHAAPHMQRGGSIVVTASVASFIGSPGLAPYCASKHALLGLVRSAAQELGPLGIRVNAVHPGPVDNRMMRSIEEQAAPGQGAAVREGFAARIPLGRYATNEEIAALCVFLVSDDSAYCNGASFVADGGMLTA